MTWVNDPITGSSQQPIVRNTHQSARSLQTHQIAHLPIPVTPQNLLSDEQKLVVVRHCIAAVEDSKMIGKAEFFGIQREIIKRSERFDCSVEAIMGDLLIRAKVC